ncbi:dockerin type I repeat-containing protein [Ruminococcus flavefaciens]|uniref:dockerin type I repeat-containing protein n=1 Tax=Ruminococcus flavefaciens TaxID=1265 RepID=UPI0026EC6BFE|nr:dockerin type I repeat-containing protein [Ruminococcus flavefaciens]
MKKTLRTVLTAAMFAAANMSALPTSAEELNTETVESQQYNWSEWGNYTGSSGWDDLERITGQAGQLFYGSFPIDDLNDHSHDWKIPDDEEETVTTTTAPMTTLLRTTTTTVYPLYGPGPNWKTTTGTVPPLTTTTTTVPQPLYGPVMSMRDFGDLNLDQRIDIFDEIALRRMLVSGMEFSSYDNFRSIHNADINQDDKVNMADLILLKRFLLGKIDSFEIDRSKMMMTGKTVETIGAPDEEKPVVTTETTAYDPREDIVVSLYGIKPAKDIIDEAVFETKENIEIKLSSEDE